MKRIGCAMHRAKGLMYLSVMVALAAGCSGGGSSPQTGGTTGSVQVHITPTSATVVVSQSTAFEATVTGATNTAVTWEVSGVTGGNSTVGTISATGLYNAPAQVPNPATVSVTVVAQADRTKFATALVHITASSVNQQAQSVPVKLGTSGGNANDTSTQGKLTYCCGGTLGALLKDGSGNFYILSNNHVLDRTDQAQPGEAITQPGLIDANCSAAGTTIVGNFTYSPSLETSGTNVDAAIAKVVTGTVDTSGSILLLGATATGNTPDPGPPHAGNGITASIGEAVAKSGRSSGLTCSTVGAINIRTSISYQKGCNTGTTFTVTYTGQVSVSGGAFSAAGDSGSLIVDENTADPVALLYGGSDTDTVGNPVADVQNAMQTKLGSRPTFVGGPAHKVAGCTLPAGAAAAAQAQAQAVPAFSAAQLALARRARDIHAPELLANPYIQAIGVGASIDHPGEPSVAIVVNPGQIPTALPAELEGVTTRIIQGNGSSPRGIFEMEEAAEAIAGVTDVFAVNLISDEEISRAKTVHAAHVDELMQQPGIQGVGITSSADAPGEAALMVFVVRGVPRNPVPVLIDGLRTRVRESSRFTAGHRGTEASGGCKVPAIASGTPISSQP